MTENEPLGLAKSALHASWDRCANHYRLQRDVASPILRLQSNEVAPRLEALIERTGGRQGILRQLASVITAGGHCLVVADKDGILVRLESEGAHADWHGIGLGSVWDERVAGTNGVGMALSEERAFTVRGRDHYYVQLANFTCSAVPLRDAHNAIIGALSLTSMNTRSPTDDRFGQHLLRVAADRLQTNLFLQTFKDEAIVSIAVPGRRDLVKESELVAVDASGAILGATSSAHQISGLTARDALMGKRFDEVFGADFASIDEVPGRVMSVRRDKGPTLDVWIRTPAERSTVVPGWRPKMPAAPRPINAPSLEDLATGSIAMKDVCERAQTSFMHGLPILLEGETGTGKSALIKSLVVEAQHAVFVDCAALDETPENCAYIQSLMEQTRMIGELGPEGMAPTTLVFDNLDEMPVFGQIALRGVLNALEAGAGIVRGPKIFATSRTPLQDAVQTGKFRDDLYYLISGARLGLPPLRSRERLDLLAEAIAHSLSGHTVDLTSEAAAAVQAHQWPGNVRELRSVLRQSLMQGDGRRIGALDLNIRSAVQAVNRPTFYPSLSEEQMLLEALHGARWNVSKAARSLGIGRATIHRKMKTYGITRPV